jgi:hypothetical protein
MPHSNVTSNRTTVLCSECTNAAEVINYHEGRTGLSCAMRIPRGWQFIEPLGTEGLFMLLCPEHAVRIAPAYAEGIG